jgi:hypothetical protein
MCCFDRGCGGGGWRLLVERAVGFRSQHFCRKPLSELIYAVVTSEVLPKLISEIRESTGKLVSIDVFPSVNTRKKLGDETVNPLFDGA